MIVFPQKNDARPVVEIKGKNYILVNCSEALHCLWKSKKTPKTEVFIKSEIDSDFTVMKD